MKKILLYKTILVFIVFNYSCNNTPTSKFKQQRFNGMNGNIESVIDSDYKAIIRLDDTIKSDAIMSNRYIFNRKGFYTLFEKTNKDQISKYVYTVSEQGINQRTDYYRNDTLSTTLELISEEPNKLIYVLRNEDKTSNDTLLSILDEKGNIIEYTRDSKKLTTLDERGNITKLLNFNKDSVFVYGFKIDRDINGLDKYFIYQFDDNTPDTTRFIYRKFDDKNNWTERVKITGNSFSKEPSLTISIREIKYRE